MHEIKRQYRRLSLIHHPDRTKSEDRSKIQEINEAYAYLSLDEDASFFCCEDEDIVHASDDNNDDDISCKKSLLKRIVQKYEHTLDLNFLFLLSDETVNQIPKSWLHMLDNFRVYTEIDVSVSMNPVIYDEFIDISVCVYDENEETVQETVRVPPMSGQYMFPFKGDYNFVIKCREILRVFLRLESS